MNQTYDLLSYCTKHFKLLPSHRTPKRVKVMFSQACDTSNTGMGIGWHHGHQGSRSQDHLLPTRTGPPPAPLDRTTTTPHPLYRTTTSPRPGSKFTTPVPPPPSRKERSLTYHHLPLHPEGKVIERSTRQVHPESSWPPDQWTSSGHCVSRWTSCT